MDVEKISKSNYANLPKKRKRSRSSSTSSNDSGSDKEKSQNIDKRLEKIKKSLKKYKKKIKKIKKKEKKHKKDKSKNKECKHETDEIIGPEFSNNIGSNEGKDENISKTNKLPMRKEDWEAEQNVIKRIYDSETGRHRLVKGSGEILEECVSRERHLSINKAATKGDGEFYQATLMSKLKKS